MGWIVAQGFLDYIIYIYIWRPYLSPGPTVHLASVTVPGAPRAQLDLMPPRDRLGRTPATSHLRARPRPIRLPPVCACDRDGAASRDVVTRND
jgi:hypothetical protein